MRRQKIGMENKGNKGSNNMVCTNPTRSVITFNNSGLTVATKRQWILEWIKNKTHKKQNLNVTYIQIKIKIKIREVYAMFTLI